MAKVLELFFRHKSKLLALLLLPLLVSAVVVFYLPRSYLVTARLLAIRRYEVLGATGPESDLQSTPAVTQATALTELLQTENFDLAVANDTDLAKYIGVSSSDQQRLQDALYTEISTKVQVAAPSYSLVVITYTNDHPAVAAQVVNAVINRYGQQSSSHAIAEGKQLLTTYQGQLQAAQTEVNDAIHAAAQYLSTHNLTPTTAVADPQYQLLSQQTDQARALLATAQANVNTINQQLATLGSGGQGMYTILDPAIAPTRPESRTKSLVLGGVIGLIVGLVASIGYLLVLVRLDRSIYSSAEIPALTDCPVVIQVPRLPRRSTAWIASPNGHLASRKGDKLMGRPRGT